MHKLLILPRTVSVFATGLLGYFIALKPCTPLTQRHRSSSTNTESGGTWPIAIAHQPSFWGHVGGNLAWHLLMSSLACLFSLTLTTVIFSIVLTLPLWLMGSGLYHRSCFGVAGSTLAKKLPGTKHDFVKMTANRPPEPADSDACWDRPADGAPTSEIHAKAFLAFDAMPPVTKRAIFDAALPVDLENVPHHIAASYAPTQWYKVRIGISTFLFTTMPPITTHTSLWGAPINSTCIRWTRKTDRISQGFQSRQRSANGTNA